MRAARARVRRESWLPDCELLIDERGDAIRGKGKRQARLSDERSVR